MHILMISGSKNKEGRTAQAMKAVSDGAVKTGSTTESIFLTDMKLERCRQCDINGWGVCREKHYCVIKDDFDSIITKIKAADAVVFANPVYFRDLSESMKSFLERMRRINFRPGMPQPGSPGTAVSGMIPAIGICLAGGGGGGAPECCTILEKIIQTCGFDVVDMIPVRRQNFEFKLPLLRLTGEWLATKPSSDQGPPRTL
jgi:NAD(P)H-dependent FMN reductase